MSDNKKYYYLKLKENFFESDEIIILESMPDGHLYSNILLKLYLRSLKNDGRLMFNERIPFNSTMLAQVTRHSVGNVEKAVKLFQDLGLIDVMDNGAIYMMDIQNFIGESSTEADRIRAYRAKIAAEKSNVQMLQETPYKCTPELEIEKEIEKEIQINNTSYKSDVIPYLEIIDYLNLKAEKRFKCVPGHKKYIKARWNEGYRLDDFKRVIEIKSKEWLNTPAVKYLQPSTLFGTKFDQYLNQKDASPVGFSNGYTKQTIRKETLPDWASDDYDYKEVEAKKAKEMAEFNEKLSAIDFDDDLPF